MTKKKSSSNRKKNRKGAASKKVSTSIADGDQHHGYEVSAYLRYLQNKQPNLTHREQWLLIMYKYAETTDMSEVVLFKDEKSLLKAIKDIESWNEADLLYFKDPRMWIFTIDDMLREHEDIFDEVFKRPTRHKWAEQTQRRIKAMMMSAIASEEIQGVLINGIVLQIAVTLLFVAYDRMNPTPDETTDARRYLKLMKCLANAAKETKKTSEVAGYALCQIMGMSFVHLHNNICAKVAFETVFRSGILEQVLLNINQPWIAADDEEDMIFISDFFRRLCCPTASMHKTFKQGSPCYNALLDILEGRLHPCKENKFIMDALFSLKNCIDLKACKPINTNAKNKAIEMFRHTCTKCRKVDYSKEMSVCAKCKFVPYCSKECQVEDWSDHEEDCKKFQDERYKEDRKFLRNFFIKHQNLITEEVKSTMLVSGLEIIDFVVSINCCDPDDSIAPALQDPPELGFTPLTYFLNLLEESGASNTFFAVDKIKGFIKSMISKLGKNFLIVTIHFKDRSCIGVVHFQWDSYGEIWFLRR
ncbi:hypothetical protein CTEN210_11653 [Chaetoceros tenuissimus]|uniref:MYND-type domain-containing protein n=1 Tax=Chaetoceros tenuissimus TaxID=426638 RepID=A0AAD3D048_9STRA|nr:hypothetical protein CTEN210_11653 [Chaetoceros tenuissimus]